MRNIDFFSFLQIISQFLFPSFWHILEEDWRIGDDRDIGGSLVRILREITSQGSLAPPFVSDEEIQFGHLSAGALLQSGLLPFFFFEREWGGRDISVFFFLFSLFRKHIYPGKICPPMVHRWLLLVE